MAYLKVDIGDIVNMKRPHPCGSKEWEVLRIGADFRIRCRGCGHTVMIARPKFMKAVRGVVTKVADRDDFAPPTDHSFPADDAAQN